jgi:hypothetical protein
MHTDAGGHMSRHEHTKRCYWDFVEARWECRPESDEPQQATEFPAVEVRVGEPVVGATTVQAG